MNSRADVLRILRALGREDGGQSLVEFALVVPLLLVLITGIIQLGIMLSTYNTLVNAARVGARELALGRTLSDPCDRAVKQTMASPATSMSIPSGDITPSFGSTSDFCGASTSGATTSDCTYSYNTTCDSNGAEVTGDTATITITYPYKLNIFGLGLFNISLNTSASDSVE